MHRGRLTLDDFESNQTDN